MGNHIPHKNDELLAALTQKSSLPFMPASIRGIVSAEEADQSLVGSSNWVVSARSAEIPIKISQ